MKKLLTLLALAELFFLLPMTVRAQHTVVNVVEQTASVTRTSTLYVGEVLLDGQQSFYYLYSEDMTNSDYIFGAVRNCLSDFKDGIYSALVPIIDGTTEEIGISLCSNSDYESMMNSDWKQAEKAGLACLPNMKVTSSSSDNLYETDADFAEKCPGEFKDITLLDDVGESMAVSGIIAQLSAVNTDRVTYTVENGVLVKHIERHINFTCEMTTVIYTKVELASGSTSSILGDVNGDGTVSVTDVAWIVNHILGMTDSNFIIANADINGDGEIDINDVMGTVSTILEGEQDYSPLILSTTKIKAIYPYTIWLDDNGVLSYDQDGKVSIESGSGDYIVESSNEQVACSYLEDSNVFITPLNIGQTIITVTDMKSGKTASIEVAIVRAYLSCPDDHHPHAIDLGLPSGTKWSCSNVDTDHPENQSPTNYGGYYAWGEIETKDLYDYELDGYKYVYRDTNIDTCNCNSWIVNGLYYHLKNIGSDIAGTQYDVAHMKWGGSWVMPTHDQMEELIDNVIYISTTIDDVNGGLFISRINNKSIFLPYADFLERDKPANNKGGYSYYFTSTLYPRFTDDGVDHGITAAWGLCIYHNGDRNSEFQFGGEALSYELWRCAGYSVRPVCGEQ